MKYQKHLTAFLFFIVTILLNTLSSNSLADGDPCIKSSPTKRHVPIVASSSCCCNFPSIVIDNSTGNVTQPSPSQTTNVPVAASDAKNHSYEIYADLAKQLDQEAKQAIATSTSAVEMAKWAIVMFTVLLTGAGIYGARSFSEAKKDTKDLVTETRAELNQSRKEARELVSETKTEAKDTITEWKETAYKKIESMASDGTLEITRQIGNTLDVFKKDMEELKSGNFLAHFISVAHSNDFLADQILLLRDVLEKNDIFEERLSEAYKQVRGRLESALDYVDDANDKIVDEIVRRVIWDQPKQSKNFPAKTILKSWINLTIAYVAKRQNNIQEAIWFASQAYELFPNDPDTLFNLACYYAVTRKAQESLHFLRMAIKENIGLVTDAWQDEDLEYLRQYHLTNFQDIVGPERPVA